MAQVGMDWGVVGTETNAEKNHYKDNVKTLMHCKAQDILSPDYRRKKKLSSSYIHKEYSDDGLSGYTESNLKAVRHRYILFVYIVLVFFRLQSGLSISWA